MTTATFKARDKELFTAGYRLQDVALAAGFHAVWHPGNGAQHWISGMDADGFKEHDD
jgi:hypothetical protein